MLIGIFKKIRIILKVTFFKKILVHNIYLPTHLTEPIDYLLFIEVVTYESCTPDGHFKIPHS